jgi:hypothetical protein
LSAPAEDDRAREGTRQRWLRQGGPDRKDGGSGTSCPGDDLKDSAIVARTVALVKQKPRRVVETRRLESIYLLKLQQLVKTLSGTEKEFEVVRRRPVERGFFTEKRKNRVRFNMDWNSPPLQGGGDFRGTATKDDAVKSVFGGAP